MSGLELYEFTGFEIVRCSFNWLRIRFKDGKSYSLPWSRITYSEKHNSIMMPLATVRQLGLEGR